MWICRHQTIFSSVARYGLMVLLLVGGLLFTGQPVAAQSGQECFVDAGNLPGGISCTANDVSTSLVATPFKVCSLLESKTCNTNADCLAGQGTCGDTCSGPSDTIKLHLAITWRANSTRYDVGLFIAEDGGDAKTGTCFQALAKHTPDGPFDNEDGDTCGDIKARHNITQNVDVEVSCSAVDANGHLLIPVCRTWKQPGANTTCNTITDTAGTGSKCDCTPFETNIVVQSPCENVDCSASDTECSTASCDEDGAPGNCDTVTPKNEGGACTTDGNECTNDICASGVCSHPAKTDGTACTADTNECTNDVCVSGVCSHPAKTDGTACTADTNECTDDVCVSGVCSHPAKADGTFCGSSTATTCNGRDICVSGVCDPNNAPSGTRCVADDDQCTIDKCDGSGNCVAGAGGTQKVPGETIP